MMSKPYARLFCLECETLWDVDFTNKSEHPAEYAAYIEMKINDGCPDDGGELRLIKERDDE